MAMSFPPGGQPTLLEVGIGQAIGINDELSHAKSLWPVGWYS
jgi:hypothetical protein